MLPEQQAQRQQANLPRLAERKRRKGSGKRSPFVFVCSLRVAESSPPQIVVTDKDYDSYGGRGITVCPRWLESFENFLADMGKMPEGLTIDRIDTNGTHPSQHPLEEFNTLFLIRVESSQEKGFAYTSHTLTFTNRDVGLWKLWAGV